MKSSTRKKRNIIIKNQVTMRVLEIQSQPLLMKRTKTGVRKSLMKVNNKIMKLKRGMRSLSKKLLKNIRNILQLEFLKKHHLITVITRTIEEIEVKREATIEGVNGEEITPMISLTTVATELKSLTLTNKLPSKKNQSAMTGMLSLKSLSLKRLQNQEDKQ